MYLQMLMLKGALAKILAIGAWVKDNAFFVEEIRTDSRHFFRVHRLHFWFFANPTT